MGNPSQGTFPNSVTGGRKKLGLELDLKLDYGASGSIENTTGSIQAGTNQLLLNALILFKNNQGIAVVGAGGGPFQTDGVTPLVAPASLTITPTGGTGSTAYKYWVAAIDVQYGITAPVSHSIINGKATLSSTVYNALTCPAVTGAAGYMWWGDTSNPANSQGLLGITAAGDMANAFNDVGFGPLEHFNPSNPFMVANVPPYLPLAVPTTAIGDTLITSVVSGSGTNQITLASYAVKSVTGAYIGHSDATVFIKFLNDCIAQNRKGHIPYANYIVDKPVNITMGMVELYIYSEQANIYCYPVVSGSNKYPFILTANTNINNYGLTVLGINITIINRTYGVLIANTYASLNNVNLNINIINMAGTAARLEYVGYSYQINIVAQGVYSPDASDSNGLIINGLVNSVISSIIAIGGANNYGLSLLSSNNNEFMTPFIQTLGTSPLNIDGNSYNNKFNSPYIASRLLSANLLGNNNMIINGNILSLDVSPNPDKMTIIGGPYDNYTHNNGATTARPSSPAVGQQFMDTTLGIPIWYIGGKWVNASGTSV